MDVAHIDAQRTETRLVVKLRLSRAVAFDH